MTNLAPGTRLGPYEILDSIGAGGMGEVYRARDTRLQRLVAVKVLPPHLAGDDQRRQRLEREAKAVASLNHPHICTLHDIGHQDGIDYLVMEYVEGQTLAQRLAKGRLPLAQVLRYGVQIADALDKAHRCGIIHRDLKPGNVMLSKAGGAKLLDFGLAKLREKDLQQGASVLTKVPTASDPLTVNGTILGTVSYMAPEQLEGNPADSRSDIFSFGAVLYEMLTGKRAFEGKSQATLIAAILEHEPPPAGSLEPMTPPALERLIRLCLSKDPDERWQSAHDIRNELEWIQDAGSQAGVPAPVASRRKYRERFWIASTALLALCLILSIFWPAISENWLSTRTRSPVHVQRLTDFAGLEEFPAISPDGKSVVFTADSGGTNQIWVRLLTGGAPLQITHDPVDHLFPRWSPDSSSILYYSPSAAGESQGAIWEISALGGSPRRISASLGGADLSHDAREIALLQFVNGQIELAAASRDGSIRRVIARLPSNFQYFYPRWSPDDQWIAYQRGSVFDYKIFVVAAKGGEPRSIVNDGSLLNGFTWLSDSSGVVYSSSRGSTILYLPTFNLWSATVKGSRLVQLTFGEASYLHPDLSSSGKLATTRMRMQFDIWKYPVNGSAAENVSRGVRITQQTGQVQTPSVSPSDRELVYLSDAGGHANLWKMDLANGGVRQVTYEDDVTVALGVPVWSPDGKNIAFVSKRSSAANADLWMIRTDGTDRRKVEHAVGWACWSFDGRWLYHVATEGNVTGVRKIRIDGGESIMVRRESAQGPALSPDGATLYYVMPLASVNGVSDLDIRAATPESGASRVVARIAGSRVPSWQLIHPVMAPDGKSLALPLVDAATTNIWAVDTSDGKMRPLTDFGGRRTFIVRRISWSADGNSIFAAVGEGDADIILLESLQY
ncbi:MAG TPA: protein kinase [Acidobacteriota bacterium]|jgi:serine/threonine protein kinase